MDTHSPITIIPPCEHRGNFQMEPIGAGVFVNRAYCMKQYKRVLPVDCRACRDEEIRNSPH